jgi:error-prone DNA polymerase
MLSSIRHTLDEIARTEHVKVDIDEIDVADPATFELIRASDTLGCFQIESPGQRELLQKVQPTTWEDLIVEISLFRPGPVKSDMITPYLRRRHAMEEPRYVHEALRSPLRETYGVIVYHEQVMRTLAAVAGYTLTEADFIRRHLDDDTMLPRFGEEFLERATARGLSRAEAAKTWDDLIQFASFGFCKAHAAAFAGPTYQSAWLKAHYTAHFLAGVLTHDPGMYPRRLILEDARQHGIPILPLDVNRSEPEYVVEEIAVGAGGATPPLVARGEAALRSGPAGEPGSLGLDGGSDGDALAPTTMTYGIRLALQDVHGISDAEIRSILETRAERAFRDVGDFLRRAAVSRPVVEALTHAGAFDSLGRGSRRDRLYTAMTTDVQREGDQLTLDVRGPADAVAEPDGVSMLGLPDYSDAERVRAELEVMGLDASRHLVTFFEGVISDIGATRARDLRTKRGGGKVMVVGVKVASQTPAIRSGQRIIFLTLDDATGPVEVTVFESVQPKVAKTVFHGYVLAVLGQLRRTGVAGVSVIAEDVWDLVTLHRARLEGRLAEALAHEGPSIATAVPRKLWHSSPGSAGG